MQRELSFEKLVAEAKALPDSQKYSPVALNREVKSGEIIQKQDIRVVQLPIKAAIQDDVTAPELLIGQSPRTTLSPNHIVEQKDLYTQFEMDEKFDLVYVANEDLAPGTVLSEKNVKYERRPGRRTNTRAPYRYILPEAMKKGEVVVLSKLHSFQYDQLTCKRPIKKGTSLKISDVNLKHIVTADQGIDNIIAADFENNPKAAHDLKAGAILHTADVTYDDDK